MLKCLTVLEGKSDIEYFNFEKVENINMRSLFDQNSPKCYDK